MEYCRNGIRELTTVIGRDRTLELGKRAARLTGLQQFKYMADALGCVDGGVADAAQFLATVLEGMGDTVELSVTGDDATLRHEGLRIVRGLEGVDRDHSCWWTRPLDRAFIDVDDGAWRSTARLGKAEARNDDPFR